MAAAAAAVAFVLVAVTAGCGADDDGGVITPAKTTSSVGATRS